MILPRVKEEKINEGRLSLSYNLSVLVDNKEHEENVLKVLKLFIPDGEFVVSEKADIEIKYCDECAKTEEKYFVGIDENIKIGYGDYKSLINALATVAQLAQDTKNRFEFAKCEIIDYPECSYRGVLLDIARGIKPMDELLSDIVTCAKAKMNVIQFHLNDNDGVCVRFNSIPESCWRTDETYSKEQLKEMVALCNLLGIEAVPEFDVPAHSKKFLTHMENLRCVVPSLDRISVWTMCAGNEETYDFCEKVIDEICEIFTGKYFNMCCDELEMSDIVDWYFLCHWTDCERCKALRKREGLKDRYEQFIYFVNRIYKMVKKHNKVPLMYSDQIDCTREDLLPKDIVFWFWIIAHPGRGPYDGCSYEKQLAMGHKMINAPCRQTYLEAVKWLNAEKLSKWEVRKAETVELSKNVLGSVLPCWQYGCNFPGDIDYQLMYARGFKPAVYMFSDRLWNDGEILYKESAYSIALTKAVLGQKTPVGLDVFKLLSDLIPYNQKIEELVDKDKTPLNEVKEILAILKEECKGSDEYANNVKVMEHIYNQANVYISWFA